MGDDGLTLLVVDDDDVLRNQLQRAFQRRGFDTFVAASPAEALRFAREREPNFATVDLRMPGGDGLQLARDLIAEFPDVQIVILTGYGSIATAVEATRLGAVNFVQKPADVDDILVAFESGSRQSGMPSKDYQAPTLARAEWEHISRVMQDCGGNISEAARRLGIHRRTLQRKLNKIPPNY